MKKLFTRLNIELTFVVTSVLLLVVAVILNFTVMPNTGDIVPTPLVVLYALSFVLGGFFNTFFSFEEST